jgi:YfiH family protein
MPMTFIEKEDLRYYQFDIFKGLPLFHAILTRQGGLSQPPFNSLNFGGTVGDNPKAVLNNHQKTYRILGFDYFSRFDVWQVHGTRILCTQKPRHPDEPHQKADGILTDNPEVSLFMRFADCVPILLVDPVKGVIGIVHAGWQGTASKISQKAVEKMKVCYGSNPMDILAGIGPSICQSCYQVGGEVYNAFAGNFGDQADLFFVKRDGQYYLDLWKANQVTLSSVGVSKIEISGLCTACRPSDWFSHRGEGGNTGRFGVLMSLVDNK